MPNLSQSLAKHDLGFLRIIAQLWGMETVFSEKRTAISQLTQWMTEPQNMRNLIRQLPSEAREAIEELAAHHGRLPFARFSRKYGEIRQVGSGKRDREAIFLNPQSVAEILWFHGLIFLDFFESENGIIEEYIFLPTDILSVLPTTSTERYLGFDKVIAPELVRHTVSASDVLFDDLCTFLAWLRKGKPNPTRLEELQKHLLLTKERLAEFIFIPNPALLLILLKDAGIVDSNDTPLPEPTRTLLSLPRWEALCKLYQVWLNSTSINELRQLESLECVGEWQNDPLAPRHFLVQQLNWLSTNQWYSLNEFIDFIHDNFPDFQRPGGNYTVWLIRRRADEKFLTGFDSWYDVEGELLRYLILGPFFWFGIVEIGVLPDSPQTYVFRVTPQGLTLLKPENHHQDSTISTTQEKIRPFANGLVLIPRSCYPPIRYQIARFCEWKKYQDELYHYQVTPESLQLAQQHNLKPQQLLKLLQKYSQIVPPSLIQAIRRWAMYSIESQIQRVSLLRVRAPEILEKLKNSRSAKYIQQILDPTTAIIIAGKEKNLVEQILELGYFTQCDIGKIDTSPTNSSIDDRPSAK
ncbi:MAG: hypothetical protein Kow0088_15800 [Anaerolineales bacterium]